MHRLLTKSSPSAVLSHNELWLLPPPPPCHYMKTSHCRTHFKSGYETDFGRFNAVSCRASSNNDRVPPPQLPRIYRPPSLTCFQLNETPKNKKNKPTEHKVSKYSILQTNLFLVAQLFLKKKKKRYTNLSQPR